MRYLLVYETFQKVNVDRSANAVVRARLHEAELVEGAEARQGQDQRPALDGGVGRELGPVEEHHRLGRPAVGRGQPQRRVAVAGRLRRLHRVGRRAHPDGVVDRGRHRRHGGDERRRRGAEGLHRRRGARARVVPHQDQRAEQADGDDDQPESEVATRDVAQRGRRRGLGGGLAHGPGQVSQGVPPFRGRRLLLPVPSPACLHRLPLHQRPPRPRPARPRWRSARPPPSCWCATPRRRRAGPPSRC